MNNNRTALLKNELTGAVIGLAKACGNNNPKTEDTTRILMEGLVAATVSGAYDEQSLEQMIQAVKEEKDRIVPNCRLCENPCGNTDDYDVENFLKEEQDIWEAKQQIFMSVQEMAAYALRAMTLGYEDDQVNFFFYKALCILSYDVSEGRLQSLLCETEQMKDRCMELVS